jgi:hypothetical protein
MMIAIVFVLFAALIVAWMAAPGDTTVVVAAPATSLTPSESPASA